LGALCLCAGAYRAFLKCAQSQRAGFLDRPDKRRNIIYQALPSTQV